MIALLLQIAVLLSTAAPAATQEPRIPVLVLTGENTTDWRWTSTRAREVLAGSGRFEVTVSIYPDGDLADRWYIDRFAVLVVDFDGARFGEPAETNLLAAVRAGMGLVAFGRGALAFGDWPEYRQLVGLRGPADGLAAQLGPVPIERVAEHPVTAGLALPDVRTDARPIDVALVEGVDDVDDAEREVLLASRGTPLAVAGTFGQGRVAATVLGHVPRNPPGGRAAFDEAFEQLLVRACEWAATGEVGPLRRLAPNTLTDADRAAGWRLLFDGTSTDGWRTLDGSALGERLGVEDGCLKVLPSEEAADLVHGERFESFELEAEWRVAPGVELPPAEALSPSLADLGAVEPILRPAGEFNSARVVAREGVVEHFLNGVRLLTLHLTPAEWSARVVAGIHADPALGSLPLAQLTLRRPGIAVWIRNVKIRRPPEPPPIAPQAAPPPLALFDGAALAGWVWEPRAKGSRASAPFRVEDGELVSGGWPLGVLRTERTFGDVLVELEYMTPTRSHNPADGGLMLRVSGQEFWPRGLEVDLANGCAGDLWVHQRFPIDEHRFRTRGVVTRRLRDAERRRGEWNHLAVRIEGDAVTVRLNGQVVNAAAGLDSTPGWIALKAEGTEVRVRRVVATPLDE